MNDVTILREAWDAPAPPSPAARADARGALLECARPRPRRRHRRLAAAVALAASIALAATVAHNLGDPGRTLPSVSQASAATVLERAATAAERRAFTPPRPDQWFCFEDRFTAPEGTFTVERLASGIVDEAGQRP